MFAISLFDHDPVDITDQCRAASADIEQVFASTGLTADKLVEGNGQESRVAMQAHVKSIERSLSANPLHKRMRDYIEMKLDSYCDQHYVPTVKPPTGKPVFM